MKKRINNLRYIMNLNRKKLLIILPILIFTIVVLSSIIYQRSNYDFTIVFSSDVHAHVDQYLGYSRLSTVIKNIEKKDSIRPLVFDCGDTFSGSTEATLTEGQYIVSILNTLPYSALALGNHDFVYSKSALKEIISNLSFPVIGTNILNEKNDHEFLSSLIIPYKVNLFKTLNIGVISLLTPTTKEKNLSSNVEGLEFSSSFKLVQDEIDKLKGKGVDFIVLLSHLNTRSDEYSSQRESSNFYLEDVLSNVVGINLVIVGHLHLDSSHNTMFSNIPVFYAGEYLKYIGVLNIKKTLLKNWDISIDGIEYKDKDSVEQDPNVVELIEKLNQKFKDKYYTVIGSSNKEIPFIKEKIRIEQTDLGRYLADALMDNKDVDVSLINAGAIREGIKKGDLTENDMLSVLPFKGKLVSVELNGKELKEVFEKSYSFYPNLFSGFLNISSNVDLDLDLNQKPYSRIVSIKISGKKLDIDKKYKVLISNFLKEGGDGYSIFKDKDIVENFGYMHEDLKEYIKKNSTKFSTK